MEFRKQLQDPFSLIMLTAGGSNKIASLLLWMSILILFLIGIDASLFASRKALTIDEVRA